MKVVLFGATGYVGSNIASELHERGHEVSAVSRSAAAPLRGSAYDADFVLGVTKDADVIVSALPALAGDGREVGEATSILLEAAHTRGARLGVVGGASMWPVVPGGVPVAHTPDYPEHVKALAAAHTRELDVLKESAPEIDWFYLIPPVTFGAHAPGERTGVYRTSTEALVGGEDSRVSGADYAIAFADEVENPRHRRRPFTVGY